MKLTQLTIEMSPQTGRVYIGQISKDGTHWVGEKHDVTDVFNMIVFREPIISTGENWYQVSVKQLPKKGG